MSRSRNAFDLAGLIGDTPVRLNLIDVTDPTGRFVKPGERDFVVSATRWPAGCQPVSRRYSGGADIAAACGTLAGETSVHLRHSGSGHDE